MSIARGEERKTHLDTSNQDPFEILNFLESLGYRTETLQCLCIAFCIAFCIAARLFASTQWFAEDTYSLPSVQQWKSAWNPTESLEVESLGPTR